MTGTASDSISYNLVTITIKKRKLHSSYADGKAVREKEVSWGQGITWTATKLNEEWDEIIVFTDLHLYRSKDNFEIAHLYLNTTYRISRGLSFDTKFKALVLFCNNASGQMQGAWRIKIKNDSISRLIPASYNKVLEMETDFKRMIYENWEE